jgi:hypothetical protein
MEAARNILVINDEAHHCYREKPPEADDEELRGGKTCRAIVALHRWARFHQTDCLGRLLDL